MNSDIRSCGVDSSQMILGDALISAHIIPTNITQFEGGINLYRVVGQGTFEISDLGDQVEW